MFSVYCKQCGSVLLLGPANIVAVQNTSNGIVVHFRCHAGHQGVWSVGAASDHPAPVRQRAHAPLHATSPSASAGATTRPSGSPRRFHLTHRPALDR
jgi:hypothetical protein